MGVHTRVSSGAAGAAGSAAAARELLAGDERACHVTCEPGRSATLRELPASVSDDARMALGRAGISHLYAFQEQAVGLILAGHDVVLAGGTGAGKSLCYQLPMLELLQGRSLNGRKRTALYLSPTKALAQDQARRLRALGARWARPMLYDGDTPRRQRAQVRRDGTLVLTNPDMLSQGILPAHGEWANFLGSLALVVVDEAHVYRGVFGSHVAQVLRRLRRLAVHYGAGELRIACSSATIANPVEHVERLIGAVPELVGDVGAPRSRRDVVLWNPEFDEELEARDSALGDAARIYAQLVEQGSPTIVFARTRKSCELIHRFAVDRLNSRGREDLSARIAPYRAGYTPEERRATERALASGDLVGVVATSALELGIDIGSLDASVCVTFPGTVTSLRQQWGRAGRGARPSLAVLVAGDDALDQFFMRDPEALLGRPVEEAIVSLDNPRIVLPHLAAAASELPLGGCVDDGLWGAVHLQRGIETLRAAGVMHVGPTGAAYTGRDHPAGSISLRSTGRGDVTIVERGSGQLLGTVEVGRAASSVHPGAVYLHRGRSYLVEDLDVGRLVATVVAKTLPYYTLPKFDTSIDVVAVHDQRSLEDCGVLLRFGSIVVEEQLVGYQRKDVQTHRDLGMVDVVLPPIAFETEAVWFDSPRELLGAVGTERLLGALHAGEHAMIALLPLLAMCDRWDIGGLSIDWHAAFEGPGIFIYDGHAGGIGIAQRGFDRFERWVGATRDAIAACPCGAGCPSCVQSPKCGNLNEPLDKAGALDLVTLLLGGVPLISRGAEGA